MIHRLSKRLHGFMIRGLYAAVHVSKITLTPVLVIAHSSADLFFCDKENQVRQ